MNTAPARRTRWQRWRSRAADTLLAIALLAALALALAPLAVNLLRTEVRSAIDAEAIWQAEDNAGAATTALLGRTRAAADESPAVDPAGRAFAGLR